MNISIAIDGPASAGKSSIASNIAKKFNFEYINTGLIYRLATYLYIKEDLVVVDLIKTINDSNIQIKGDCIEYNGKTLNNELRTQQVDSNVSYIAEIPEIREIITEKIKRMVSNRNIIMDGRDIATNVLKDADLKFFVTATAEIRAKRRYEQNLKNGIEIEYKKILNKIEKRDQIDYNRVTSPLKKDENAKFIDTSDLSFSESVDAISKYIVEYSMPKIVLKRVIIAENNGFCHGVLRAVNELDKVVNKESNKRVNTLGEIIHNKNIINYFSKRRVNIVQKEEVHNLETNGDVLVIRAHGVPEDVENVLKENFIEYVDATCGKVKLIHKKVRDYYKQGYDIVIVGNKEHPEIIGANSYCDYKAKFFLDGKLDGEVFGQRVCVLSQTTEKYENFEKAVELLKDYYEEVVPLNTICDATYLRQRDASELAKKVNYMIIVGDRKSSNSNKLYEVSKKNCDNAIMIERATDLSQEILRDIIINNYKVGVTSGASTPDWIMKEVILMIENGNITDYENNMKIGQVLSGDIVELNEEYVLVNVCGDSKAILPTSELSVEEKNNFNNLFYIGNVIEGKIISLNNSEGYVVLSRKEIFREKSLDNLKQKYVDNKRINVVIKEDVKGGVIAEHMGTKLFIPASHLDFMHIEDLSTFVGKEIEIKIIEMKEEKKQFKIVGSRRAVLEEDKELREEEVWGKLVVDQIVKGEVKRINTFGAFVDVNGIDGLLHISEISWGRVEKVSDIINIGDVLELRIIAIDPENHKLSLSKKALLRDPWDNIEEKYPVGAVVLGKVVRFAEFGAFVELEPSVDALVHISQISHKRVNDIRDFLEVGQEIKAKIVEINKENKRIELSIKVIE